MCKYEKLVGGYTPSPKDGTEWEYDKILSASTVQDNSAEEYPTHFRLWTPGVLNQESKSTCVAHSLAIMKQIQDYYDTNTSTKYSTSFIYLLRQLDQTLEEGMYIKLALENLRDKGVCPYLMMPDNINFKEAIKIRAFQSKNQEVLDEAAKHKIKNYALVSKVDDIKQCLMDNHSPLPIGISVYQSFVDTEANGVVKNPDVDTESYYGGHCMLIIGWTVIGNKEYWVVQNSWGEYWGDAGYCYIPTNYSAIDEIYAVFDIEDYPVELTDISGRWSEEAIIKCIRSGLISGYEDKTFKPTNNITREELAAILTRLLKKIN